MTTSQVVETYFFMFIAALFYFSGLNGTLLRNGLCPYMGTTYRHSPVLASEEIDSCNRKTQSDARATEDDGSDADDNGN